MKRSHVWVSTAITIGLCTSARGTGAVVGDYTKAQAAVGASVFAAKCATCHGKDLSGVYAPPLVGPLFTRSIASQYKTAADLYGFISVQMPLSAPGSLKPDEYYAVESFVLSKNGYPDGAVSLSAKSAATVRIMTADASPGSGPSSASGSSSPASPADPATAAATSPTVPPSSAAH